MTTPGAGTGASMDATETLVRKRFESAVGDLHLDVASLVGAGTAAGQRMQRRRRIQQGAAGVAGLAVITIAGALGLQGGLFEDNSSGPAHPSNVEQLVPSNPRAFAAAVIAHFPSTLKVEHVEGQTSHGGAGIYDQFKTHWTTQPNDLLLTFSVGVQPLPKDFPPLDCSGRNRSTAGITEVCQIEALPHGGVLRLDLTTAGKPGTKERNMNLSALADRRHSFLSVQATAFEPFTGEAATLSRVAEKILRDPAVGAKTYQLYLDRQQSVPGFALAPTASPTQPTTTGP